MYIKRTVLSSKSFVSVSASSRKRLSSSHIWYLRMASTFEILFSEIYSFQASVLESLPTVDLFRLLRCSKLLNSLGSGITSRQWNINIFLRRWVDDSGKIRDIMRRSDIVISGSAALQFLERSVYEYSDLDFYIGGGKGVDSDYSAVVDLCRYLVLDEGYSYCDGDID